MYDFDPYLNDYEMFGAIDPEFNSVWPALVSIYAVILGIALLVGLAYYIMNGIALLRMAKRTGVKHGWLGFIPFADSWLLGRISDVGSTRRHSGARLLGFTIATECCALGYLGAVVAMFVSLFTSGALDGTMTDSELLDFMMPYFGAWGVLMLLLFAVGLCALVFRCMALYRVGVNFGGASGSGFGIALVLTALFCQLATYIILLVLSGRTPACTDGIPTVSAPQSGEPTDSVFQ